MATSVSAAVPLVVQLLTSIPAEERYSLLESCSLAHQGGPCIEPADATEADTLHGFVDFSGGTRITLEVTDTDPGRSLYASRELFFEAEDNREERARAIGIALGVLATTLTKGRAEAPEDESPEEDPQHPILAEEPSSAALEAVEVEAPRPRSWGLWASAGATIDPRWGSAAPSGAFGIVGYPQENWGALLRGQGAWFAPGAQSIPLTQLSASLGPSFRTTQSPLYFSTALTLGVHFTQARLTQINAELKKGSHTSALAHAEASLGWQVRPAIALTLTPSLDLIWSSSTIIVDDVEIGSTGAAQISVLAGALFSPPPPATK